MDNQRRSRDQKCYDSPWNENATLLRVYSIARTRAIFSSLLSHSGNNRPHHESTKLQVARPILQWRGMNATVLVMAQIGWHTRLHRQTQPPLQSRLMIYLILIGKYFLLRLKISFSRYTDRIILPHRVTKAADMYADIHLYSSLIKRCQNKK